MAKPLQAPRGTQDILPSDYHKWDYIAKALEKVFGVFNFGRIETPIYEHEETFVRPIGEHSDIVEKEMFEVKRSSGVGTEEDQDTDKRRYILRPEYTAGIVRSYIERGMGSWPQPVKLWYLGPAFRYDRPQKGRYRQFSQFGLEIFGAGSPTTDAYVIMVLWHIFTELKIEKSLILDINTIGDKQCRTKIKKTYAEFFGKFRTQLCKDCQRRLSANPLRILDCKELSCQTLASRAPAIIDLVCEPCKDHFRSVLEHLDDLNITYDLNPRLVRGLDYYTRTTFEIRSKQDERRQASLGGGGRYDELVSMMGGQPTPAVGFAGGIDRLVEYISEQNVKIPQDIRPQICVIQFGQFAHRKSLILLSKLAILGYPAIAAFDKESLNAQLKYADKMKVSHSLIIGQKEALANEVIIRNMSDGSQETVSVKKLEEVLRRKIKK